MSAGKGDKPRNCFSSQFRSNYDEIDWASKERKIELIKQVLLRGIDETSLYYQFILKDCEKSLYLEEYYQIALRLQRERNVNAALPCGNIKT